MDEKFTCPHCGQRVAIANPPLGAEVKCPGCRKAFTLMRVSVVKTSLFQSWLVGFGTAVLVGAGILVALSIRKKEPTSRASMSTEAPAAAPATRSSGPSPGSVATAPVVKPKSLTDWLDVLASTDQDTRETARNAIRKLGPKALPELLEMIDKLPSSNKRRGYALEGLGCAGSKDGPEAELALKFLKDENPRMRTIAATAVRRLFIDPHVTVPIILEMLSDPDPKVRRSAAMNLGFMPWMGPLVRDAIPALARASSDEDKTVVEAAKTAVKNLEKVQAQLSQTSPVPEGK